MWGPFSKEAVEVKRNLMFHDYKHNDYKHNDYNHNDYKHNDYKHNDYKHNDYKHNDYKHNDYKHFTFDLSANRWTFLDFCSKFSRDEKFKVVEKMKERESLFNEFITDLRKREKMDTKTALEQVIEPQLLISVRYPCVQDLSSDTGLIGFLWLLLNYKIVVVILYIMMIMIICLFVISSIINIQLINSAKLKIISFAYK